MLSSETLNTTQKHRVNPLEQHLRCALGSTACQEPGAKGDCCHPRQVAQRYGSIPDVSTLLSTGTPEPMQLPQVLIILCSLKNKVLSSNYSDKLCGTVTYISYIKSNPKQPGLHQLTSSYWFSFFLAHARQECPLLPHNGYLS